VTIGLKKDFKKKKKFKKKNLKKDFFWAVTPKKDTKNKLSALAVHFLSIA